MGFLAENIIRKCVSMSLTECPGCKDGMKSEVLHLHSQRSLLEKLQAHFEPARAEILNSITILYKNVEDKLPHSDDRKKDMTIYCNVGRHFLITCSPQTIYYGRHVTEQNDSFIMDVLSNTLKSKEKKKKPVC